MRGTPLDLVRSGGHQAAMDIRALLLGTVFAAMGSSAFPTARVIVAHAPPLAALSVRFLISGVIAVAVARALGQSWRLSGPQARAVILFGLCQNAAYLGLNFIAVQWVEASLAVIIAASMPLVVATLAWVLRGERIAEHDRLLAIGSHRHEVERHARELPDLIDVRARGRG